jgi:hypothetical protein
MAAINKRAGEKFPIALRWEKYLATGETILTVVTTVPAGLTKEGDPTIDGATTKQRVSGGTSLAVYDVTFKITTSTGEIYEDIFTVRML